MLRNTVMDPTDRKYRGQRNTLRDTPAISRKYYRTHNPSVNTRQKKRERRGSYR